jgi:hypothetical protein
MADWRVTLTFDVRTNEEDPETLLTSLREKYRAEGLPVPWKWNMKRLDRPTPWRRGLHPESKP